jgi:hypothetical protein
METYNLFSLMLNIKSIFVLLWSFLNNLFSSYNNRTQKGISTKISNIKSPETAKADHRTKHVFSEAKVVLMQRKDTFEFGDFKN